MTSPRLEAASKSTRTEQGIRNARGHKTYGPCKGCGAEGYGISTSGPDYCGACACGVPPEISQLKQRNSKLFQDVMELNFALGLVTGHFPPFNDHTRKIAESCLEKRKTEWESR